MCIRDRNKGDVISLGLGDQLEAMFEQRDCPVIGGAVHNRGWFSLFDKQPSVAKIKIGSKNIELRIAHGANLTMHVVGEAEPREIPWASIDRIDLSKPAAEWNR